MATKKPARKMVPALSGDLAENMKRRLEEFKKYEEAYKLPHYKMGGPRFDQTAYVLNRIKHVGGSLLDVGTGRGEMMDFAKSIGFDPVWGTETVSDLIDEKKNIVAGYAHYLPFHDKQFNVSMMIDVIEHLIPGDDYNALKELERVTSRYVIISANNRESHAGPDGVELHINRRPYEEWHELFQAWIPRARVRRYKAWPKCTSCLWRIDLK